MAVRLLVQAQLPHRGGGVTATDHGEPVDGGDGLRDPAGAGLERRELEDAHRPVPEDRLRVDEVGGDQVETCRRLLAEAGDRIVLPLDVVCAPEFSAEVETTTVSVEQIPDGQMGLDVGPRTVEAFGRELADARTVFWNGPMGVFELAPFQAGTRGVAEAVAAVDGLSVVGGGDSAAAVRQLGLDEAAYGHISTGGGASLEYLEGRELPGLAVLAD